jgi:hypothetical protein
MPALLERTWREASEVRHASRPWRRLLSALVGVVCLALAACGSHGVAAQLGRPVTMSLAQSGGSGAVGTVTFTPTHATHVAAYYAGHAIPLTGAQNPAQIRQGACTGPLVVNLSDGIPPALMRAAQPAAVSTPATASDPGGGLDVAIEPSDQWYIIVYNHANDPDAAIVACGHPLSGSRQYFDLYQAAVGPNGIALGTALFDPIVATRVDLALNAPSAAAHPTTWSLHNAGCSGPSLASGTVPAGSTSTSGVAFRPLDTSNWWMSVTQSGATACAKVGS